MILAESTEEELYASFFPSSISQQHQHSFIHGYWYDSDHNLEFGDYYAFGASENLFTSITNNKSSTICTCKHTLENMFFTPYNSQKPAPYTAPNFTIDDDLYYRRLLGPKDKINIKDAEKHAIPRTNMGKLNNEEIPFQRLVLSDVNDHKENSSKCPKRYPIITMEEVNRLLIICMDYKAHFSRRCAERPFEHVISILRLVPWYQLKEEEVLCLKMLGKGAVDALIEHIHMGSSIRRIGNGAINNDGGHVLGDELLSRLRKEIAIFPAFFDLD
jgi:hypothetical protein